MTTCTDCKSTYDETNITVPQPVPDKMCSVCGTLLTDSQIESLKASQP